MNIKTTHATFSANVRWQLEIDGKLAEGFIAFNEFEFEDDSFDIAISELDEETYPPEKIYDLVKEHYLTITPQMLAKEFSE